MILKILGSMIQIFISECFFKIRVWENVSFCVSEISNQFGRFENVLKLKFKIFGLVFSVLNLKLFFQNFQNVKFCEPKIYFWWIQISKKSFYVLILNSKKQSRWNFCVKSYFFVVQVWMASKPYFWNWEWVNFQIQKYFSLEFFRSKIWKKTFL